MDSPASPAKVASTTANASPATPKTTLRKSANGETPVSCGASSKPQTNNPTKHTQAQYKMYLEEDWKAMKTISFERFLPHIFRISIEDNKDHFRMDNVKPEVRQFIEDKYESSASAKFKSYAPMANTALAKRIMEEPEYEQLRQACRDAIDEKDAYAPFADFTNHIIKKLRDHRLEAEAEAAGGVQTRAAKDAKRKGDDLDRLLFVRADRKAPIESVAKLYPDLFAIRERIHFKRDKNGVEYDRGTISGQKAYPFAWWEPLMFVEMEQKKNLTKGTNPSKPVIIPTLSFSRNSQSQASSSKGSKGSKKRGVPDTQGHAFEPLPKKSRKSVRSTRDEDEPTSFTRSNRLISGSERSGSAAPAGGPFQETGSGLRYQVKCIEYALHMLSHGGARMFSFGLLLKGNTLQVASYQRSSIIVSLAFNFLDQGIQFIGLLEGLEKLTDRQFGRNDLLIFPEAATGEKLTLEKTDWRRLKGAVLVLLDDGFPGAVEIKFLRVLHVQHAVLCRGSFVVVGEVTKNIPSSWQKTLLSVAQQSGSTTPNRVIVKSSSIQITRVSEDTLIKKATDTAEADPTRKWAKDRLPEVLFVRKVGEVDEHEIRSAFALAEADPGYEIRILRLIIFTPLEPITNIICPLELLRVYIDLIEVHKFLVQDCGILHRDISLNNLMYRVKVVDGIARKYGVLNDFDLAVFMNNRTKPHKQRTGTQPFMATDLLKKSGDLRQYPRHDIESFYYVKLHQFTTYKLDEEMNEMVEVPKPPFREWADLSMDLLYERRNTFWRENTPVTGTTHFDEILGPAVSRFQTLIKEGMDAYDKFTSDRAREARYSRGLARSAPQEFNLKTWNGHVTHDKVLDILKDELSILTSQLPDGSMTKKMVTTGHDVDFGEDVRDWEQANEEDKRIMQTLITNKVKGGTE